MERDLQKLFVLQIAASPRLVIPINIDQIMITWRVSNVLILVAVVKNTNSNMFQHNEAA